MRAAVRAERGERAEQAEALYLCRHCGSRLWPALNARGWTMSPVSEHAFAPQAA